MNDGDEWFTDLVVNGASLVVHCWWIMVATLSLDNSKCLFEFCLFCGWSCFTKACLSMIVMLKDGLWGQSRQRYFWVIIWHNRTTVRCDHPAVLTTTHSDCDLGLFRQSLYQWLVHAELGGEEFMDMLIIAAQPLKPLNSYRFCPKIGRPHGENRGREGNHTRDPEKTKTSICLTNCRFLSMYLAKYLHTIWVLIGVYVIHIYKYQRATCTPPDTPSS